MGYKIHVGKGFYAGFNSTILDMEEVRIGDNCLIERNVGIYMAGHNMRPIDGHKSGFAKPVTVGNNVLKGGHSVVIGGVNIADNSIITAGSVITKGVSANSINAGNPAKIIKVVIVNICLNNTILKMPDSKSHKTLPINVKHPKEES